VWLAQLWLFVPARVPRPVVSLTWELLRHLLISRPEILFLIQNVRPPPGTIQKTMTITILKSTGCQIARGRRCIMHFAVGWRSPRSQILADNSANLNKRFLPLRSIDSPDTSSCHLRMAASSSCPSLTDEEVRITERLAANISSKNAENNDNMSQNMSKRIALSKAITLVESKSPRKRLMADMLLKRLKTSAGKSSFRLGIAGPPGVGKSTFVEAFGMYVLGMKEKEEANPASFRPEKVAVLCIDPSSHVTGGSILGDKTRMSRLSYHPRAFVRPSPSSGHLGGLGSFTYDAASLCELAGYELTIIETVGVGQSEVELAECCDLFLLLLAPGGGDELQGYKKGIVEVADMLVVNKADGETQAVARKTANDYKKAMGLLRKSSDWWGGSKQCGDTIPPVLLVSAKTGYGLEELWNTIIKYQQYAKSSGSLSEKRRQQNLYWMWKYLRGHILETTMKDPRVKKKKEEIERSLDCGYVAPRVAAAELWRNIIVSVVEDGSQSTDP
jgi:LAO/AO transport system kinase